MHERFDIAVAWDWEYDREFVNQVEDQTHAAGLLFYSVSHHNTHETLRRVQRGTLSFGALLDRAGDATDDFVAFSRGIAKTNTVLINHPSALHHANDKATMHLEFLSHGINVPFTIIISPYNKKTDVELTLTDLANLGRPFIIKPANTTGGGIGVILGAETLKDVIESRQHHKNDKYLLQKKIIPTTLNGHKAWFRVFSVFDEIIPCWWDDQTHVYGQVSVAETEAFGLTRLHSITRSIAQVCKLDFFSTEIAVTTEGEFVVVDYVNDICDMRLQTKHPDGVPDAVVSEICHQIVHHVALLVPPR